MELIVYHGFYGCDTGCCGHVLEIDGDRVGFDFLHERGLDLDSIKEWVKSSASECYDTLDWDSVEVVKPDACYGDE